jgi:hypothetical protein
MKPVTFGMFLILLSNAIMAQTWTYAVTISNTGINYNPDFVIDKTGNIHCVWVQYYSPNFTKIFYSKSSDNGVTWTTPVPITTNTSLWIDEPHIKADTNENLFVCYDYNVGAWPSVKICYMKFDAASSSWGQQTELATGTTNRLVVDNNNKVYFFWSAGTEHYRYLDHDILCDPIELSYNHELAYFFNDIITDGKNNIHCIGSRQSASGFNLAYFNYSNGAWSNYHDLSQSSFCEGGISVKSNGIPAFIWKQTIPDSSYSIQGSYYAEFYNDTVQTKTLLCQKSDKSSIAIDGNDLPHIVEWENVDSINRLVHRYIKEDFWLMEAIEEFNNTYDKNILKYRDNFLYLVYNKADTTLFESQVTYNSQILFRKLEVLSDVADIPHPQKFTIFPNPFSETLTIELANPSPGAINIKIFDLSGNVQYSEERKDIGPDIQKGVLMLNISNGKQFQSGNYIVQISNGDKVFNKCISHY